MKMRSSSNASGDMSNPGTEVTINCVIVFVSDISLLFRSTQSTLSGSNSGSKQHQMEAVLQDLHITSLIH